MLARAKDLGRLFPGLCLEKMKTASTYNECYPNPSVLVLSESSGNRWDRTLFTASGWVGRLFWRL